MNPPPTSTPRSFRATLLSLIMLAVTLPLVVVLVYHIHQDHQLRNEQLRVDLAQTTQHSSWMMAQTLHTIASDMDALASDLLLHPASAEVSLINHDKLRHLKQRHTALGALFLLDDRFVMRDAIPASALYLPLQHYEQHLKTLTYEQIARMDTRTRIHLLTDPTGATQIFYVRPILHSTHARNHAYEVKGLLLAQINADALVQATIAAMAQSDKKVNGVPLKDLGWQVTQQQQTLFSNLPPLKSALAAAEPLPLGDTEAAPLTLTLVSLNRISWWQTLQNYHALAGITLVILGFILWVTKRLTDRLVAPLTHLNNITRRLEASDFSERNIDSGLISKMRYQEFTELFRLLDTMESTITQQFAELHASHTTLEARVMERTNELIENVSLLDEQRRVLQQLIRYSMDLQQVETVEQAGLLTLAMVERTTRCNAGLHLIRKDYVSGYSNFTHLPAPLADTINARLPSLLTPEALMQISREFTQLHLLRIGNDQLDYFGFIAIELSEQTPLATDALVMLGTLITSAIRQYNSTNHLHWLAHIDSVTLIANRHYFSERYEQKVRDFNRALPESHFALFIIDANSLKQINDRYGHRYGDDMLKTIAQQLKLSVRSQDTLARVGGDEFCLILDRADTASCRIFSERLQQLRTSLQLEVAGARLPISFSFGYACTEEDSLKNLMILADERMYQDKKRYYLTQVE